MKPVFALVIGLSLVALCLAHAGHSHDENPAFKYSRAANEEDQPADDIQEDEIFEEDIVDLPPQQAHHGHSHDHHGHSHGHHGHSHGHHGHSHGGHGHSHGGGGKREREMTPEEKQKHRERIHKIWDDDDEDEMGGGKRSVWFQAIGATLLISAAPFFILFLIPLDNSKEKQWLMKIFLSFASGGLLGDAFLHLIPHAMMASEGDEDGGHTHSHSHGHSHGGGEEGEGHAHDMTVGLGVLSGIIAFLVVEKLVRIVNGGEGGHGHSHGGGAAAVAAKPKEEAEKSEKPKKDSKKKDKKESGDKKSKNSDKEDTTEEEEKSEDKKEKKEVVAKKDDEMEEKQPEVKVAGYLNLFADCFHNFTDGLAIGASFAAGESVGVITTLTILLHEVPHEIGDYAILIQSGVPPMKAIMLQLLTAVGALTGCVVSLLAQGDSLSGSSAFILPFTAGGFIYIATVSVIPDILEGTSTLKQSFLEISALLAGVGMMVIIAQYE